MPISGSQQKMLKNKEFGPQIKLGVEETEPDISFTEESKGERIVSEVREPQDKIGKLAKSQEELVFPKNDAE